EHDVRLAGEADDHPTEALDKAADLVDDVLAEACAGRDAVVGVGFGIPAPITREGRIGSPALLPAWADLSPREELERRLGLPVRLENDANLGALGEHVWGAGRACSHLVYIKIATGIGAGIVLDGQLSTAVDLLREPLQRGLADTAMAAAAGAVEVVPGQLGPRASALGGVALVLGAGSIAIAS